MKIPNLVRHFLKGRTWSQVISERLEMVKTADSDKADAADETTPAEDSPNDAA